MRKSLLFLLVMLIPIGMLSAQETKKLHLSFNKEQFIFAFDSADVLKVELNDAELVSTYGSDTSEPCLPWIDVEVPVTENMAFAGLTHSAKKHSSLGMCLFQPILRCFQRMNQMWNLREIL